MPNVPKWTLQGDWFDTCKCSVPCPCTFAQPPTSGDCEGILAWHINFGRYGDVQLDGLSVIGLGSFEGNLWDGGQRATMGMFIDERADGPQREAIQMIFSGQAGGWPAVFGSFIRDVRGMEFAPIRFHVDDDLGSWRAEIPGKVTSAAQAIGGPTTLPGQRVQTHNAGGAEMGPGAIATWGKSTADKAEGFGFKWDRSGRSSKHMRFLWSGPDA